MLKRKHSTLVLDVLGVKAEAWQRWTLGQVHWIHENAQYVVNTPLPPFFEQA